VPTGASPIDFPPPRAAHDEARLRADVRAFLAQEHFAPAANAWMNGVDPAFSRRLGAAGLVGTVVPARYGGAGLGPLERAVIVEELLAAGAPVAAHWVADRQSAPMLLRYGTEEQRARILPALVRGECLFAIGLSEPEAGSDLAAIRTRAEPVAGGFRVTGRKVWTSHAHVCDYMIALVRTGEPGGRQEGLTQLLVDLTLPGLEVSPIRAIGGGHHFAEVVFDGVVVPEGMVIGEVGQGWAQATAELAYERSGAERILSTFPLLAAFVDEVGAEPDRGQAAAIGTLVAETLALRRLSRSVAAALVGGDDPSTQAALVKDAGTRHEQAIIDTLREHLEREPAIRGGTRYEELLAQAVLSAPTFTLRGGTNEILRGIVARGLGLR
jgi:alkylation response protein AidB-like acyl-CoA dehydrogenase